MIMENSDNIGSWDDWHDVDDEMSPCDDKTWDESIDEKPLAYCYNCKTTFSYDKKSLDESETMSVKCPTCGTDICLLE